MCYIDLLNIKNEKEDKMTENPLIVKDFKAGDKVFIEDERSKIRSLTGIIFTIDYGTIVVHINGYEINIDGQTKKGKTPFGECILKKEEENGTNS